jgi:hypothetical protein
MGGRGDDVRLGPGKAVRMDGRRLTVAEVRGRSGFGDPRKAARGDRGLGRLASPVMADSEPGRLASDDRRGAPGFARVGGMGSRAVQSNGHRGGIHNQQTKLIASRGCVVQDPVPVAQSSRTGRLGAYRAVPQPRPSSSGLSEVGARGEASVTDPSHTVQNRPPLSCQNRPFPRYAICCAYNARSSGGGI